MRLSDTELAQLEKLLSKALDDDSMRSRIIPTLRGKGKMRYGSYLRHGLDAVEAEIQARIDSEGA